MCGAFYKCRMCGTRPSLMWYLKVKDKNTENIKAGGMTKWQPSFTGIHARNSDSNAIINATTIL